jgi:hypothetical protein
VDPVRTGDCVFCDTAARLSPEWVSKRSMRLESIPLGGPLMRAALFRNERAGQLAGMRTLSMTNTVALSVGMLPQSTLAVLP